YSNNLLSCTKMDGSYILLGVFVTMSAQRNFRGRCLKRLKAYQLSFTSMSNATSFAIFTVARHSIGTPPDFNRLMTNRECKSTSVFQQLKQCRRAQFRWSMVQVVKKRS